uniref:Uncharacterized protein n=1 Tax=Oryza sativa subsp. japonica TaxID=39947 RepID=Q67VW9_ORYSJ|nr:hypothetical protein [Oryza sativa Japonica Group]
MGPSEIGEVSKRKVTATTRLALSSLRMEKTGEREAEREGDEDQGTDDKVEVVARYQVLGIKPDTSGIIPDISRYQA